MTQEKVGFFKRLQPLWIAIDVFTRLVLSFAVIAVLILAMVFLFSDSRPKVPQSTVLVINPQGTIVEQLTEGGMAENVQKMMGAGDTETLLKDLVDAIDLGAKDKRVKVLLLDLNSMGGTGLTKLQDLANAIIRFKKTGKKVLATADSYMRDSYYLAAHADEIYMHHQGFLILEGYGRFKRYYREGLEKLGVDMNIFRVGKYKSYVEPYERDSMSDAAKEANLRWLGGMWEIYLKEVAVARGLKVQELKDYSDLFNERLKESKGKLAQVALKYKLIDHAASRDQLRSRLIKKVGEKKSTHSYYRISYGTYLEAVEHRRWGSTGSGDAVAVIIAKGTIVGGSRGPGAIGGRSTAALIRKARNDKRVKALVLRVDSGGGSAFASEVIRRELELTREAGKPVVASMGSVAASGGYVISMPANEIWAHPATITGSIGIFAMIPTFQEPLAKYLGIRVDGIGTNSWTGAGRIDRKMTPELADVLQQTIEEGYRNFVGGVAKARKMSFEQVDEIAQGRVWIGADAIELKLVDKLGNLTDAINSAAKLAKLEDGFGIKYIRKAPSFRQQLMARLFSSTKSSEDTETAPPQRPDILSSMLGELYKQAAHLAQFNDPKGLYLYWPYVVQ